MKVVFYGTRGSIPVPELPFVKAGGNTSCVLVRFDSGEIAVLDAGTGIRRLGDDLLADENQKYDEIFIGLSHTHWDHIQGFPFFKPVYDPNRRITISMCGREKHEKDVGSIFAAQMQQDYFPVSFNNLQAEIGFCETDREVFTTRSGATIYSREHNHPGMAFGYRLEEQGKSVVYCTDVEHSNGIDERVVAFAKGADLLIHDAQYTTEELGRYRGWGHSSWEQAIEVSIKAGVKKLALFHHDPDHDDHFLFELEREYRKQHPNIFVVCEGMEIRI